MLTREIPAVTKNLLIINSIMFIATWVTENMGIDLTGLLGLHFFLAPDFHLYQIFTYMFMHGGLGHIFMNMFMLWMFGPVMEAYWGSRKFFFYYIICGLGAGFCQELAQFGQFYIICNEQVPGFTFADTMMVVRANQGLLNLWTTVGASGALYGILLAYGMYFPNERMFVIPFPFPLKVKWVIAGSIALGTVLGYCDHQRRRGPSGPPRRHALRLHPHQVLAQASLHGRQRLRKARRRLAEHGP